MTGWYDQVKGAENRVIVGGTHSQKKFRLPPITTIILRTKEGDGRDGT